MHNLLKCLHFYRVVFCSRVAPCCSAYHYCITVYHSTKPELRLCVGSNPAGGVSEVCHSKNLWQLSRLGTRLNAFLSVNHFIIIISLSLRNLQMWRMATWMRSCEGWLLGSVVVNDGHLGGKLWRKATWMNSCEW